MPLPDVRCLKCEFEARPAVKIMRKFLGGRNRDEPVVVDSGQFQPGTRQHGFQSGLLPFQQALSLQGACIRKRGSSPIQLP